MSTSRRAPRRRRSVARALLKLAGVVIAFLVGLALGQAVEDNPRPGGTQTSVRTLAPRDVEPLRTVTVTVTAP